MKKDDRLAHLVKESWRGFVRALQARLSEHGVPFGHWQFLRILWDTDGLTQRELSDEAGVMEPTTAAAIKAMEELGYVVRRQVPENRKNVYVHLTPQGRALQAKLEPLAEEVNRIATGSARAEDIEATRRVLVAMLENLAGDAAVSRSSPRRASPPSRTSGSSRGSRKRAAPASSRSGRSRAA
jgi:DNA-binding MarR family transcriptional regulator